MHQKNWVYGDSKSINWFSLKLFIKSHEPQNKKKVKNATRNNDLDESYIAASAYPSVDKQKGYT